MPELLTIELVPKTAWGLNLRSVISAENWLFLRRSIYRRSNYRCEVCGGKGPTHPVECHEKWLYHDELHIQRLTDIQALCPACHEVKHIGLAISRDRRSQALLHLVKVNRWTRERANEYIEDAFRIWQERSLSAWELDLTWIDSYLTSITQ